MPTIPDSSEIPLIDREQFDMLVETGEDEAAEMIRELLDLFTGEAGPKLEELVLAAAADDRQRCIRISHAVAGASANLGGQRLSTYARAYENAAASMSVDDLTAGANRIQEYYIITLEAMESELEQLG